MGVLNQAEIDAAGITAPDPVARAAVGDVSTSVVTTNYGFSLTGTLITSAGRTNFVRERALSATDTLKSITINASAAGSGAIVIATPNADASAATPISILPVTGIVQGQQTIALPNDPAYPGGVYPAGSIVGFFTNDALLYYANSGTSVGARRFQAGPPVVGQSQALTLTGTAPALRYTVQTIVAPNPLTNRVAALEAGSGTAYPAGKRPRATEGNQMWSWRAKAGRIRAGEQVAAKIVILGSSSADRKQVPLARFARAVSPAPDGLGAVSAQGYITAGSSGGPSSVDFAPVNSATISYPSSWNTLDMPSTGLVGLDGYARTVMTGTDTATFTGIKFRDLRIFTDDASGIMQYRVDAGAWITITAGGTATRRTTIHPAIADGTHTIEIQRVSGDCRYLGMYASGDVAGAEVSKAGNGGTASGDHVAIASQQAVYLGIIQPDVIEVWLSRNDWVLDVPLATFKSNMQSLIDAYLGAVPTACILLIAQPETNDSKTIPLSAYRDVLFDLAAANKAVEVYSPFDLYGGTFAQMDAAGTFQADDTHQTTAGAIMIDADRHYRMYRA